MLKENPPLLVLPAPAPNTGAACGAPVLLAALLWPLVKENPPVVPEPKPEAWLPNGVTLGAFSAGPEVIEKGFVNSAGIRETVTVMLLVITLVIGLFHYL